MVEQFMKVNKDIGMTLGPHSGGIYPFPVGKYLFKGSNKGTRSLGFYFSIFIVCFEQVF